ncbi:hypothetical protein [Zavarzinia sp.]|uniref:hypothetical protein n=1 Tax=Zavarzinia sp. TaxID=2027920 RepID=UPI003567DEA9
MIPIAAKRWPRRPAATLALCLATLLALALPPAPASAQLACPPDTYPAGDAFCIPYDYSMFYDEEDDSGPPEPPIFSADEFAALLAWERDNARAAEAKLLQDPAYRALKLGSWDYSESPPQETRRLCQASFLQLNGGVLLMDWAGDFRGTFLAFYGAAIPKAQGLDKVRVTLTQSGEAQTVKAFHMPFPWAKELGMIMFTVPSTEALITSIEDRQDFQIAMNGATVIRGEWHSGLAARDWLSRCIARRG